MPVTQSIEICTTKLRKYYYIGIVGGKNGNGNKISFFFWMWEFKIKKKIYLSKTVIADFFAQNGYWNISYFPVS